MNKDELKKKISELKIKYETEKRLLFKKYAFSNNKYKIGDIIEDHIGYAKIIKISWTYVFLSYESQCFYECDNLTKKFKIIKKQPSRTVWQSNVKRVVCYD